MIGLFLEKIEWLEPLEQIIDKEPDSELLKPEHSYSSASYLIYNFKNKEVLTVVTQGAAVTSATVELLSRRFNFEKSVRIGTMGTFQNFLEIGDIVFPVGAISGEGSSKGYVPDGYPAVPDLELCNKLYEAFKEKYRVHNGIIYTTDAAFSQSFFSNRLSYKELEKIHCLGVDMETSTFLNVCRVKEIPAVSIQIVSDSTNYPDRNSTQAYIDLVNNRISSIITDLLNSI